MVNIMDDRGRRCSQCGQWVLCPTCNNIIKGRRLTAIYGKLMSDGDHYESEHLFCSYRCQVEYNKKRKIE
jgi:hypothetical protein